MTLKFSKFRCYHSQYISNDKLNIKDTVICNEHSSDSSDSRDMNNQDLIIENVDLVIDMYRYLWIL